MANYEQTTAAINSQIKTNGNRKISGQILQNVLNAIVNNLKQGYLLVGIATPDGNPGTPDQDVCWLATKGTYVNYGNITVGNGKLAVIKYNGKWTYDTVDVQGSIKSGDGITVDPESGKVSVNVGDGLQISGGKVTAKVGDGMQIADGNIAANVGDGLQISEGKVTANLGNGLKKDDSGRTAIDLIAGSYVNIENGNKINCTLDVNPFYVVDELPDAPPAGLNNKLWLVPVTGQPAVNLYKWNEKTSEFEQIGTITLSVNTALFIKKGTNDITEPLELDSSIESTKPETEQEVLTIKASDSPSVFFKSLTEDTEEGGVDYMVVKAMMSKGNLANRRYIGFGIVKKDGSYTLLKFSKEGILSLQGTGNELIFRPVFYIQVPAGENWDNANSTFSISGIYSKLKTALALNADVVLTYPSRQIAIATDLQSFGDGQDIVMTYRFSGLRFSLTIKSDDSMTIISGANIWIFNAKDYSINTWYNASGTNKTLYNDLRKLINDTNNVGGILGYLCDRSNIFVITGINTETSGSITTLTVSFTEANSQRQNALIIDSTGAFSVRRWPALYVAWADDYNLIASGKPRPDAWLVADGTDVSFYNEVSNAYKYGYQLILKEYSYDYSGKRNQYTVKNILDLGTGYQLFYESNGLQYILTINSDGSMSTVCNTFSAIDIGVDTFYPTSNKSYSGLTDFATQFIRLAQSGMPVFLKTKNNQFSTSEDVLVPIMNVIRSSGSVTAYYLHVESSRIGRFSINVTSKGSVTINTLGS